MVRKLWFFGVLTLICGSAVLGCHRSAVQQKPPPDPLLVSVKVANKPPVAGKLQSVSKETNSPVYPPPPSFPETDGRNVSCAVQLPD